MESVDTLFEQFKQLPDWDRFPMPDKFYKHFGLKKPQAASLMECLTYTPPAHQSLNKNGKIEIRPVAEGGVREIKDLQTLPTEVQLIKDETETDMLTDSQPMMLTLPKEDNKTETPLLTDHSSANPSCVSHDTAPDAPCRDAECSPPSQPPQNGSS